MTLLLLCGSSLCARTFTLEGDRFLMDGKPFRYVGGDFHYFRQHHAQWEDTIKKMAVGGINAVQTYIAWNFHEPQKGVYNWVDRGDLVHFLELCKKYNLYVILRPGPYICAEWELGGFPYWTLNELSPDQFRKNNTKYLALVDKWMTIVYEKVAPYLYKNGGPIIMVQVENEYGFFGCDHGYMNHLADLAREKLGSDVFLFTTDNSKKLDCGSAKGALRTVDFGVGADIQSAFQAQRAENGHGPDVCSEYWVGWYDEWSLPHHTRNTSGVVADLTTMLSRENSSVSQYMYYGGTNFGFTSTARGGGLNGSFRAYPTSYDYDAPLSEAGDMTWKWQEIRKTIAKFRTDIPNYEVRNSTKKAYGTVQFTQGLTLWDALSKITTNRKTSVDALSFEALNLDYGFVLYRASVSAGSLEITQINDRAYVYVDKTRYGLLERTKEAPITIPAGTLDLLVENMGRPNAGLASFEHKGLITGAKVSGKAVTNFEHFGFNFSNIQSLTFTDTVPWGKPGFYRATFNVDEVGETFLNPTGWVRGVVFVNGFNLGRYWTIGPQQTLYVPSPILKVGVNELIIFDAETTGTTPRTMAFVQVPVIDKNNP